MNLLNFSQTSDFGQDEEREWASTLHSGIDDISLTKLTDLLPPECATEIYQLISELGERIYDRHAILTKLVDKVLSSFNPKSRSDYLWYLQFTFSVLLLKDLPTSIFGLQGHLLSKCFTPSTVTWDANPVKMDYFASPLYNIMEDDKNLIFVTSQIENRSSFGFYMSLCMLWKSIYGCIGVNQPMFRLYPPTDLIDITKKISKKNIDKCFDTILNFIILHSKIASLVFHRKHRTPHYKCYEEFFEFDAKLINYLKKFLETLMDRVDSIWRRQSDNLDYLTMIEYLQVDISDFDSLARDLQKRTAVIAPHYNNNHELEQKYF